MKTTALDWQYWHHHCDLLLQWNHDWVDILVLVYSGLPGYWLINECGGDRGSSNTARENWPFTIETSMNFTHLSLAVFRIKIFHESARIIKLQLANVTCHFQKVIIHTVCHVYNTKWKYKTKTNVAGVTEGFLPPSKKVMFLHLLSLSV